MKLAVRDICTGRPSNHSCHCRFINGQYLCGLAHPLMKRTVCVLPHPRQQYSFGDCNYFKLPPLNVNFAPKGQGAREKGAKLRSRNARGRRNCGAEKEKNGYKERGATAGCFFRRSFLGRAEANFAGEGVGLIYIVCKLPWRDMLNFMTRKEVEIKFAVVIRVF